MVKPLDMRDSTIIEKKQIQGLRETEIIEGEQPCMNTIATYTKEGYNFQGRLIMTNYRIVFIPDNKSIFEALRLKDDCFNIPIGFIAK